AQSPMAPGKPNSLSPPKPPMRAPLPAPPHSVNAAQEPRLDRAKRTLPSTDKPALSMRPHHQTEPCHAYDYPPPKDEYPARRFSARSLLLPLWALLAPAAGSRRNRKD